MRLISESCLERAPLYLLNALKNIPYRSMKSMSSLGRCHQLRTARYSCTRAEVKPTSKAKAAKRGRQKKSETHVSTGTVPASSPESRQTDYLQEVLPVKEASSETKHSSKRKKQQLRTSAAPASHVTKPSRTDDTSSLSGSSIPQSGNAMDIVFVSAEVAPWSKTGGLGDVVGSLPIALARRGHRVMVIAPRYQNGILKSDALYEPAKPLQPEVTLDMGDSGQQKVQFHHLHRDHVDWVFVDHPCYHRPGNPYADEHGAFGDNQFRYALLSMAACEAPLQLHIGGFRNGNPPGFPYGQKVLFVANDWHAGLVPAYLAGKYRRHGVHRDSRCIVAIHNLSHQGVDPASTFPTLGLPSDWYEPLSWEYPTWAAINGPAVNILKGSIAVADRVMTVSQGYAWEITTKEGGWGLDEVLKSRQHVLNGIANGIDTQEWDPEHDKLIPKTYSSSNLKGKEVCKSELQKELGLAVQPEIPLLGFIGRLDHQKGPDLLLDAVQELANRNCQIVMLGSGADEYEARMRETENTYPQTFRGWVGFSIQVAHRIIAGCDIVLMPSRFEPCGLNQLFAMRYGTVPIAHATGGLRDTIEEFNPFASDGDVGTGWTYSPCDASAMLRAVDLALLTYRDHKQSWRELMLCGMSRDLSWNRAAKQYEQLFDWAFLDPPVRPT